MPDGYLQIGDVAKRTGLSLNTIRHYDEAGLVSPSARSEGGFRLYSEQDVERLLVIRRMKPLGFSLDDMGALLAATDALAGTPKLSATKAAELRATLQRLRHIAIAQRDRLTTHRAYAEEFIASLGDLSKRTPRTASGPDEVLVRSSLAHARTYEKSDRHALSLVSAQVREIGVPAFVQMVDDAADESARGTIFQLALLCREALQRIADLERSNLVDVWAPIAEARRVAIAAE
jgi:MerR family copper efflux transcriptional regulator